MENFETSILVRPFWCKTSTAVPWKEVKPAHLSTLVETDIKPFLHIMHPTYLRFPKVTCQKGTMNVLWKLQELILKKLLQNLFSPHLFRKIHSWGHFAGPSFTQVDLVHMVALGPWGVAELALLHGEGLLDPHPAWASLLATLDGQMVGQKLWHLGEGLEPFPLLAFMASMGFLCNSSIRDCKWLKCHAFLAGIHARADKDPEIVELLQLFLRHFYGLNGIPGIWPPSRNARRPSKSGKHGSGPLKKNIYTPWPNVGHVLNV